jgi:hypothetical protein
MKNIIVTLVLLIPFSLFAQTKVETVSTTADVQTDAWMNKISSNSELRGRMMEMMIAKTSGDKEEMMKLVNSILSNTEMHQMIISDKNTGIAGEDNTVELQPRGMMNDSEKSKQMTKTKPVLKK